MEEKCKDCKWADELRTVAGCLRWASPKAQWSKLGGCPSCTTTVTAKKEEHKVNPLKAAKREMKSKRS